MDGILTRCHVVGTATAEGIADLGGSGETEVSQLDLGTVRVHQDVIRLQVAMVYTAVVAVLHGVEDLQEHALEERVVAGVGEAVHECVHEVAAGAQVEHDVDVGCALVNTVNGHDVRVVLDVHVHVDLALLVPSASGVRVRPFHDLHGKLLRLGVGRGCRRSLIDGAVDDAVCALAELLDEAKSALVDGQTGKIGRVECLWRHNREEAKR